MSRIPKNQLTIEPLATGGFRMFGFILGRKIRLTNASLQVLETKRTDLMQEVADAATVNRLLPQMTWLTTDMLRSAEAMFHEFRNFPRPLIEYARAGLGVLGLGKLVPVTDAVELWETDMKVEQKLSEVTVRRNRQVVKQFIKETKPTYVSDITGAMVEDFSSLSRIKGENAEKGASMYSKITRASCIRAFLNFCVAKKIITKSPFEMDMKKLLGLAKKQKGKTQILSPDQAKKLLDAAIATDPRYVPYVILTTWCFMRSSEVKRITPEDVKLDRAVPFVEPASHKVGTASYRTTNIPENILPLLRECIESGLWAKGTTPFYSVNSFRTLRMNAGLLELGERNARGFRKILKSEWQENILRHTGISMLYQKFSDMADKGTFREESVIAAVTRQAGNSEDVAFEHYINIADAAQAAEFFKITGRLGDVSEILTQRALTAAGKKVVAQDSAQAVA